MSRSRRKCGGLLDEKANQRDNGNDQRDQKHDLRWCVQGRHVVPLLAKIHLALLSSYRTDASACVLGMHRNQCWYMRSAIALKPFFH